MTELMANAMLAFLIAGDSEREAEKEGKGGLLVRRIQFKLPK